jgi:hypothetical protein
MRNGPGAAHLLPVSGWIVVPVKSRPSVKVVMGGHDLQRSIAAAGRGLPCLINADIRPAQRQRFARNYKAVVRGRLTGTGDQVGGRVAYRLAGELAAAGTDRGEEDVEIRRGELFAGVVDRLGVLVTTTPRTPLWRSVS